MRNPADLKEICEHLVAAGKSGDPLMDVVEKTPYSDMELLYELALAYLDTPSELQEEAELLEDRRAH